MRRPPIGFLLPLTPAQLDRAVGSVLASAAGDALGSQYEFGPALDDSVTPTFGVGQFGHGVGEWTDDTSMAMPTLDVLARGDRLEDAHAREEIVGRWIGWAQTAKDVGAQTRAVLARIPNRSPRQMFSQHPAPSMSAPVAAAATAP